MNKKELIEKIEALPDNIGLIRPHIDKKLVLGLVRELDEPTKPVVPQVVIDYYEFYKGKLTDFEEWFAEFEVESDEDFQQIDEVGEWLYNFDFETQKKRELALATLIVNGLDAVEVEKEKRYLVKMKGIDTNFNSLNRHRNENYWIFSSEDKNTLYQTHHTRKELEEADFGWVFDCEGIEVEEVTE